MHHDISEVRGPKWH